jgi:hypothetical protein
VSLTDDFDLEQLRAELRKMTDAERSQQSEAPDCFRVADNAGLTAWAINGAFPHPQYRLDSACYQRFSARVR